MGEITTIGIDIALRFSDCTGLMERGKEFSAGACVAAMLSRSSPRFRRAWWGWRHARLRTSGRVRSPRSGTTFG